MNTEENSLVTSLKIAGQKINMELIISQLPPGAHGQIQPWREYIHYQITLYKHITSIIHIQMTLTHGCKSYQKLLSQYDLCTTGLKLKFRYNQCLANIILLLDHIMDWKFIRQRKQAQMEKDVIHKTLLELNTIIDLDIES